MITSSHAVELEYTSVDIVSLLHTKTEAQSCTVLTQQGEPIAVIQNYESYQRLISHLAETQKALYIAETRERLRQMNDGLMKAIPFEEVVAQNFSSIMDDSHELPR